MTDDAAALLQRPDGTLTANALEADKLLREAWVPIFQSYDDGEQPDWDAFYKDFGDCLPAHSAMRLDRLDGCMLLQTLMRMANKSAPGADGWRVKELKSLPIQLLDRLAEIFNIVEDTGNWPDSFLLGMVSLISKGEGTAPLSLRPITVMSAVYRLWAATRVRIIMQWQENWINNELKGYRSGCGAEDVWWEQALRIENALLSGEELHGSSLDYAKCFDKVPVEIVLKIAELQGMSDKLVVPLRSLYASLTRRFKFGGGVGEAFAATNGIVQGCLLSVALLNILVNVWAQAVKQGTDGVQPACFADDAGAMPVDRGAEGDGHGQGRGRCEGPGPGHRQRQAQGRRRRPRQRQRQRQSGSGSGIKGG